MNTPPDYIVNPPYPCSCSIKIEGKPKPIRLEIQYCKIHAVAHELFRNVQNVSHALKNSTVYDLKIRKDIDKVIDKIYG